MRSLVQDLRYAVRILAKSPTFTVVAVLSIALAVGPNTAVFSIVNGVLFDDRGLSETDGLVQVYQRSSRSGGYTAMHHSTYETIVEGTEDVFAGVTAFNSLPLILGEGSSRRVLAEMVTGGYFDVLGVDPAPGRGFLPEENETPGAHSVVVLSHRLWQGEFGGDPGVVGSRIQLNGRPYAVVGVGPEGFEGRAMPGLGTDLWVPLSTYPHLNPKQMSFGNLWTIGRVRDGVPVERALGAVSALAARVDEEARAAGETNRRFRLEAWPLDDFWIQPDLDRPLLAGAGLLMGAVILVLLIACTNLAAFLLTRARDRRREMAVRAAMGASRRDLVRQLLVESLIVAGAGGAVGLGLGALALRAVQGMEPPIGMPLNLDLGLDGPVLLFTGGVTLLAGLVFGLAPSLRASRAPLASTLRAESARAGEGRGRHRARSLLVAGQVGLSLVLLLGAGLFVRSLHEATAIDPGFDTGPAAVVTVNAIGVGYRPEELPAFDEALLREAESVPGVEAVGMSNRLPLELGTITTFLEVPGVPPPDEADAHRMEYAVVSPDYFEAMGIELLEGRTFDRDDGPEGQRVAVVSRATAERFWPDGDALGRVMTRASDPSVEYRVVGVVEDVKIWTLTEPDRLYMYVPMTEQPIGYVNLVARGPRPPGELAGALREMVRRVDERLFVQDVKTMEEHLGFVLYLPRMAALLLSVFGGLALVLAGVGLYGLVSYSVARRTREVGIRISLGADRRAVLLLAMRRALVLVGVGGALGLAAALAGSPLLGGFLIGIQGADPLTFVLVPVLLAAVALVAAYLPARRATRVDPVEALRTE